MDAGLKAQRQAQFDDLADGINRIFMGDIRDFYYDDAPASKPDEDQLSRELEKALGDDVEVKEV